MFILSTEAIAIKELFCVEMRKILLSPFGNVMCTLTIEYQTLANNYDPVICGFVTHN